MRCFNVFRTQHCECALAVAIRSTHSLSHWPQAYSRQLNLAQTERKTPATAQNGRGRSQQATKMPDRCARNGKWSPRPPNVNRLVGGCSTVALFTDTLHTNRLRGQPFLDEQTRSGGFFLTGFGRRLTGYFVHLTAPVRMRRARRARTL